MFSACKIQYLMSFGRFRQISVNCDVVIYALFQCELRDISSFSSDLRLMNLRFVATCVLFLYLQNELRFNDWLMIVAVGRKHVPHSTIQLLIDKGATVFIPEYVSLTFAISSFEI